MCEGSKLSKLSVHKPDELFSPTDERGPTDLFVHSIHSPVDDVITAKRSPFTKILRVAKNRYGRATRAPGAVNKWTFKQIY